MHLHGAHSFTSCRYLTRIVAPFRILRKAQGLRPSCMIDFLGLHFAALFFWSLFITLDIGCPWFPGCTLSEIAGGAAFHGLTFVSLRYSFSLSCLGRLRSRFGRREVCGLLRLLFASCAVPRMILGDFEPV
ncbi:hypothetical protein P280DRAFT_179025 [Massarina eburnea CBS 473.64]|uniref:Uncharacterized protein n=1 Tax=Massarina eburnea CBS 473.64 TaxID=1395130 RepID=A0A6A6SD07_9PLEO|nr:hypothetical protein P280DRAFT_179025 [Massarina eburnea CBS 473.64]